MEATSTDTPTAWISQADFDKYGQNSLANLVYYLIYIPGIDGKPGRCSYFRSDSLHIINENAEWYKVHPIIIPRQRFTMTDDGRRISLIWER